MKKIKITEFTSGDAVKALIGAFIFNKVTGKDAEAKKIQQSVSSHDKAIEKQLATISKGIEKNMKVVKQQIDKMPKDQKARVQKLASKFDY
tara:strand:+ start:1579 stop:1851 length:273 start_codon:yes stop_codon:yes gene_type:complete